MLAQSTYSVRRTFIELDECEWSDEVPVKRRSNTWDCSMSWGSRSDSGDAESEATSCGGIIEELLSDETSDDSSVEADAEYPPQLPTTDGQVAREASLDDMPSHGMDASDAAVVSSLEVVQLVAPKFCKFGAECYSKRCRFDHPDRIMLSGVPGNSVGQRPCKNGSQCSNYNKEHRQRFKHADVAPAFSEGVNIASWAPPMNGVQFFVMMPYNCANGWA